MKNAIPEERSSSIFKEADTGPELELTARMRYRVCRISSGACRWRQRW
ncbi:hypothetical protein AWB74_08166 [Caballeronia arvi]|uniref:Uncharacterized protein n=1 Tax=Caballeronia arvi TaxID=1777135 RepID=A0A158L3X9_9BURK|nr:hypothetical protein AWB74_08166 [Caballeronia arvi]